MMFKRTWAMALVLWGCAGFIVGGCAPRGAAQSPGAASGASAASGANGGSAAPVAGAVKPTPEQEANRQRGMAQGAAIQAASKAARGK